MKQITNIPIPNVHKLFKAREDVLQIIIDKLGGDTSLLTKFSFVYRPNSDVTELYLIAPLSDVEMVHFVKDHRHTFKRMLVAIFRTSVNNYSIVETVDFSQSDNFNQYINQYISNYL